MKASKGEREREKKIEADLALFLLGVAPAVLSFSHTQNLSSHTLFSLSHTHPPTLSLFTHSLSLSLTHTHSLSLSQTSRFSCSAARRPSATLSSSCRTSRFACVHGLGLRVDDLGFLISGLAVAIDYYRLSRVASRDKRKAGLKKNMIPRSNPSSFQRKIVQGSPNP